MESSTPFTAQVTGSRGQSSAPDHRPPSSSSSASTSSSSSSSSPPSSRSPASRPRSRSSSVVLGGTYSATNSERPPLPTPDHQPQRQRELPQEQQAARSRPESTLSRVHLYPERFATIRRGDIVFDESGLPRPNSRRGHRRRSTHVTPADLASFQREVLGIETTPSIVPEEDTRSQQRQNPSSDPHFEQLNHAFESANMSLNSGNGMVS